MKVSQWIFVFILSVNPVLSYDVLAQATVGNGGDTIAIEATSVANSIVGAFELSPDFRKVFPEVDLEKTKKLVEETKFRSVDEVLYDFRGVKKDAVNFDFPEKLILIQKESWKKLSVMEKRKLIFHEVLCLLGLESSDQYFISSRLNAELIENSNSSFHGYCEYKKSGRECKVALYFNAMTLEVKGKWNCVESENRILIWAQPLDANFVRIQQIPLPLTKYTSTIGLAYEDSEIQIKIPAPPVTGFTMPNTARVRFFKQSRKGIEDYWMEMPGSCTLLY